MTTEGSMDQDFVSDLNRICLGGIYPTRVLDVLPVST